MAKSETTFLCSDCGWSGEKWYGRCPNCGEWGTVNEYHPPKNTLSHSKNSHSVQRSSLLVTNSDDLVHRVTDFTDNNLKSQMRLQTGFAEFDRVLGGGIVSGSVILIAGEPGIGKSTLLLDTANHIAQTTNKVLYISGEESVSQIQMRAQRIHALSDHLLLASTTDLETALTLLENEHPDLAIIDSVQTIMSNDNEGISGGSSQVREVTRSVISIAKNFNIPTLLVGHVTKDGSVAGPRTLEHLVDVVCQFDGDPQTALRMLRATKNRFGPTDEVGCFDMTDDGIEEVADPTGLFMSDSDLPSDGTCITFTREGHRSLPIEIQSLVTTSVLPTPRRAVNGVDSSRVSMLVAVLYKHAHIRLLDKDLYISTVAGGIAKEPSVDLAICCSLGSAASGCPIDHTTAILGEVALTGEIRPLPYIEQRLADAQRMGFTTFIIPMRQVIRKEERFKSLTIIRVATLAEALRALHLSTRFNHQGR
ncbi:MAG: DNA repair protein RadA [Aeriscardovia sp.]|nr:DNA repair protein RadA [Aeriscardovia sp.]